MIKQMKSYFFMLILSISFCTSIAAQESVIPENRGFNPNRVFVGSSVNIGLSNNFFNIGINPEIGYSLNNWLDAGAVINLNYYSQNNALYKDKNFNFGGGGFLRIWPVNFLHLQIQPEYNWINNSRTFNNGSPSAQLKLNAPSFLAGIGYGSRQVGSRFSHFTIMIDLMQEFNSPYRDQYGDPQPVFRGGFGIYLNPKRK